MYKILFAEDEDRIREGIKKHTPWHEWGFEVVAEARNGAEAYDQFLKMSPQVILTDIRMPVMDGLKLMEQVRVQDTKVKLIVLSGYGDFDYARQAISLGVSGYLLKPTKEQDIESLFKRLKLELDKMFLPSRISTENRLDDNIARVVRHLAEHYAEKNTLQEMADMAFLSAPYFSKLFKTQLGVPFIDYLTELRIGKAKELLRETNHKVIDVALLVGYEDFRHFCKLFKAKTGFSPKQYSLGKKE
ncbi:response regulator [Paenibacillus koleovorans]|uniref:response regulator n=1 Tax=Paenibacillus koleovorans TaxID=121608 RepID=UPI0013E32E2A|nr:response regulator [Paenibacillus koleovorans]